MNRSFSFAEVQMHIRHLLSKKDLVIATISNAWRSHESSFTCAMWSPHLIPLSKNFHPNRTFLWHTCPITTFAVTGTVSNSLTFHYLHNVSVWSIKMYFSRYMFCAKVNKILTSVWSLLVLYPTFKINTSSL